MTPNKAPLKQLTVRWPDSFWEAVAIEATKRRTSLQVLITDAVSEKLGIPVSEPEATSPAA